MTGTQARGMLPPYLGTNEDAPVGGWYRSGDNIRPSKFACPAVNGRERYTAISSTLQNRQGIGISRLLGVCPGSTYPPILNMSKVRIPSKSMFFTEGSSSLIAYHTERGSDIDFPTAPHNGGTPLPAGSVLVLGRGTLNLVYVDGHTANMPINKLPFKDLNRTNVLYNAYFWFPENGNKDI